MGVATAEAAPPWVRGISQGGFKSAAAVAGNRFGNQGGIRIGIGNKRGGGFQIGIGGGQRRIEPIHPPQIIHPPVVKPCPPKIILPPVRPPVIHPPVRPCPPKIILPPIRPPVIYPPVEPCPPKVICPPRPICPPEPCLPEIKPPCPPHVVCPPHPPAPLTDAAARGPKLGIFGEPVESYGIYVTSVVPGSIAEEMGIEVGTYILGINDLRIATKADVGFAMAETNRTVTLIVLDNQTSAYYELEFDRWTRQVASSVIETGPAAQAVTVAENDGSL
ncbi:PDZ domain-containing protein [Stratiformator vulcanicus]|nr:PDZ domain-containing protein [Stratiformator vulcanicus]